MDNLLALKAFLRVAEEGSLAAAADKLGISRALVSKYVIALENQLGTRLFNRTTRRLSMTESGRSFYERSAQAVADLDEAMRCAADSGAAVRGTLRINCAHGFGRRYISPAIGDYLTHQPEVRIDLELNDRLVDIVEEGFDLAIRIGRLEESTLVARKLATTQLVVCGAPAYLARHGEPKVPEDLVRHNCLGYTYTREQSVWSFRRPGAAPDGELAIRVDGCVRANDGDTLMEVALAGHGLIMVPTFLCGGAIAGGLLKPLLLDWETPVLGVHAGHPSRKHLSAKVRSFVDFLAERFEGIPCWETWREVKLG